MARLMEQFPPGAKAQVTLANWRTSPFNRWAFHHVRELLPTAAVANDPANVMELPAKLVDFSRLEILAGRTAKGRSLSLDEFLHKTDTDGLVVLHQGSKVLERYGNGMTAASPHILMSVTKSMLGLLSGVLADLGELDPEMPVAGLVPEVRRTAFEGASIRDLLDMRVGIAFPEDYTATSGPIIAYRKATGWNPLGPGEEVGDLRSFLPTLTEKGGRHGGPFNYVSPCSDLLGWVIERATGRRFADLFSELIWQPMGAAHGAYITVDRLGAPRTAGGMCATTEDLARIGQLIVEGGRRGRRKVLPKGWLDDIERNGDRAAWDAGSLVAYFPGAPMHYRSKWYVENGEAPLLFGVGIHGQNLFVDRANAIVIAKFSSQALPLDEARIALTTRAVAAIRRHLAGSGR